MDRRLRKTVPSGRAYVHASYNNTIVTLTDQHGNVLGWSSAGSVGFKGPKKATPYVHLFVQLRGFAPWPGGGESPGLGPPTLDMRERKGPDGAWGVFTRRELLAAGHTDRPVSRLKGGAP